MTRYQGKALERGPATRGRGPRRTGLPYAKALRIVVVMLVLGGLAMVPWADLRKKVLVVDRVQVTGLRYLDGAKVRKRSGLAAGQDLLDLDLIRARQLLLLEPRIATARVRRTGLRDVEIQVVERVPMLAVDHGEPWEIDAEGVLLEPLQAGVVADVPLLAGPDFSNRRPGSLIQTPEVRRGLAWTAILSDNALRLAGQVSEVDVSDPRITRLVMLNGVRVVAPAWPNGARQLSGLRATLADLTAKGMMPREVDVRFKDQIVVRGAKPTGPTATATTSRES
ncbi:MAG: FtsQ-type POTRA domain-containing protein [Candidatus Eisenbacteria bacterium]